jgi:hypothetical protein
MLWTEVQKDWKGVSKKLETKWSKLTDADSHDGEGLGSRAGQRSAGR